MALGGVVDDGVVAGDDAVQQLGVADVAHDELHAVGGQPGDVLGVSGVGQPVQDGDVHPGVVVDHVVHEVAADEAAAARDDDVLGIERFSHGLSPICLTVNRRWRQNCIAAPNVIQFQLHSFSFPRYSFFPSLTGNDNAQRHDFQHFNPVSSTIKSKIGDALLLKGTPLQKQRLRIVSVFHCTTG